MFVRCDEVYTEVLLIEVKEQHSSPVIAILAAHECVPILMEKAMVEDA